MQGRGSVRLLVGLAACAVWAGCHREVEGVPLITRMIGIADKFFDVQALDADHAVVVGYGGKVLLTSDGGFSWTQARSGTNRALFRVRFVDPNTGWVSGQAGLILHTTDGGQTWKRQNSGTNVYLFSMCFLNAKHGWAVGDKSLATETFDGGATWSLRKVSTPREKAESAEEAVVSADPILYDVQFVDEKSGWIVGEFGKIFHTADGGQTWTEQERTLLGSEVVDMLDLPTLFGLRFINAQTGVASGLDGRIVRTVDGGATWKFEAMKLDYPIVDPLYTPTLFPDGTGWAIGAAGEVVRLATPGGAWERAKLGMEVVTWLRGMSWLDENDGWIVGGFGMILHTKDGGKTWIPSLG